jgi:hypothetical protein
VVPNQKRVEKGGAGGRERQGRGGVEDEEEEEFHPPSPLQEKELDLPLHPEIPL